MDGIIGLIYILLIYLLSSLTGSSFTLDMYSVVMMLVGIAAGAARTELYGVNIRT